MLNHHLFARTKRACWLACLGASCLAIASCSAANAEDETSTGGAPVTGTTPGPTSGTTTAFPERGKALFDRLLAASNAQQRSGLAPIVRIVSPLADSTLAPGVATASTKSFKGSGFVFNVEVVTRDGTNIELKEATLAPPVFGIRHVAELNAGAPNPDVPGFYVFFDKPLVTPDSAILPAFNNFAAAFNVAGTDDTPGKGVTAWLGWHVLESFLTSTENVTMTVFFVDRDGRVARDEIALNVNRSRPSGQDLTPDPETFRLAASAVESGGPEVSLIAPRVPTSIAVGPTDGSLNPTNGALFFIHLSAVDRAARGIAVSETGQLADGNPRNPNIPAGLIFDPTVIPTRGPNRNYPGMILTFDVPLRQPNGNIVPAGTNLAGLFDVAGSEIDASGAVRTTADWVVGGSLVLPSGQRSVTISASVTDNAGRTGTTKVIVAVSPATSGQDLTR